MAESRLSTLRGALAALWQPAWGKACYAFLLYCSISEVANQFLPDQLAEKIPRIYHVLAWVAATMPWWGGLLVIFLFFFAAFFELLHRLRLDVKAAEEREKRMAAAYAVSMGEITTRANERLSKLESRTTVIDTLAKAYLLDRAAAEFKAAWVALDKQWSEDCRKMQAMQPGMPEPVLFTTQLSRIGTGIREAMKRVESLAREAGGAWPSDVPETTRPTVVDGYSDISRETFITLYGEYVTYQHRLRRYIETVNPDSRQADARRFIDNYARSLR